MIQCGRSFSFALKTGKCLRIAGNFIRQKLEGDETMEPSVLGLIDYPHSAATQRLDDAVVRNGFADHGLAEHSLAINVWRSAEVRAQGSNVRVQAKASQRGRRGTMQVCPQTPRSPLTASKIFTPI